MLALNIIPGLSGFGIDHDLEEKKRELKKTKDLLKKSEERSKNALKDIDNLNKKVSSVENENTRLRLLTKQAEEYAKKTSKDPVNDSHRKSLSNLNDKKKCFFENRGACNNKRECKSVHPIGTCQSHSKLGSCASEPNCKFRHPIRICREIENFSYCHRGDSCRFRHPIELLKSSNSSNFLGDRTSSQSQYWEPEWRPRNQPEIQRPHKSDQLQEQTLRNRKGNSLRNPRW